MSTSSRSSPPHFCVHREIHPSLPQFKNPDGPNAKPVDFRRLLLNKCQQEFESGAEAMKAVQEREKHDKEEKEKEKAEKEKAVEPKPEVGECKGKNV